MILEINNYIAVWENRCYKDGIPDEVPTELFDKVPSYKRIALAILRNDIGIIGIEKKPCAAYKKLKRIEISKRPTTNSIQLELF